MTTLECITGDIANQPDIEAVVNAANARLMTGGGVAGALHAAAGQGLAEECLPLAPIRPGQAVITGAHGLPNSHVIHCLGPVYGEDDPADALLADCYRGALKLAEEYGIHSIAFPALSTGAFGYPFDAASEVCADVLEKRLPTLKNVTLIRFVLFRDQDRDRLEAVLAGREELVARLARNAGSSVQ